MKKILFAVCTFLVLTVAIVLNSCNVTRTVSTESKYYTKGDTTCTIVTRTTESYDAKKNATIGF